MTMQLHALCLLARDPARLADFWGALLDREVAAAGDGRIDLLPTQERDLRLGFLPDDEVKQGQNLIHLDLTSATPPDQDAAVRRTLELGGRHADVGQGEDEDHVVLADPEDNEFCVIAAGNNFLADTGRIGAVNCDGTRALGQFWSAALGWPLVWDQDEETAIQSPAGGSKITWSGPPLMPRTTAERWWFELSTDEDRNTEVQRLVQLGATADGDDLRDPDGNRFRLRA